MFGLAVIGLSCLKLLLIPAYRSTDFEVHRNWMAVTHSLPLDHWYVDQTSQWTLDYPPLFAWFEFLLAKVAVYFDAAMLDVNNLEYASPMTVLFQRLSVIVTDLVYAYGCKVCSEEVGKYSGGGEGGKKGAGVGGAVGLVLLFNAGLLLVDHIHFQYNGFLFGILFIAITRIFQKREVEAAFWFSVLLNLKHIYLYLAPAFFIYLLRSYVLAGQSYPHFDQPRSLLGQIIHLVKLGVVVVMVFGLSFGPFVVMGQLGQVLSRLFPFKRGLSHAYWAPNFWALYNFADKLLLMAGGRLGWVSAERVGKASMTGGLVQEFPHAVLPSVSPATTLILTVLSIMPCLVVLWRSPNSPWQFVRALVLCGFGAFMFGWHVHEKAILMVVLPLGLLCMQKKAEAQVFLLLSIVGHFSLFPLFFTAEVTPIKVLVVLLHTLYTWTVLNGQWGRQLCRPMEVLYLLGLLPLLLLLEVGTSFAHSLPFLPLMLVSVHSAVGVTYSWLKMSYLVVWGSKRTKRKIA